MHASPREERLHIRITPNEKALLVDAARVRHVNVSQFVLQTSIDAAKTAIAEEHAIFLNAEDYDWLQRKLEEPPKDLPELRKLLNEQVRWNG